MVERTFLQFRIGPSVYGLPVSGVVEIIRVVAISPVPRPSPGMLGVINLRGRVVPVFDLCCTLGLEVRPLTLRMYIIIADVAGEAIGILVDDVLDVVTVPELDYQVSRALAGSESFTAGVVRIETDLLTVLNLAPLVDRATAAESEAHP